MGKINNKDLYPDDIKISINDSVVGSDFDNDGETKNFPMGSVVSLINNVNELKFSMYRYSKEDANIKKGVFNIDGANFKFSNIDLENNNNINVFNTIKNNKINIIFYLRDGLDTFGYYNVEDVTTNSESSTFKLKLIKTIKSGAFVLEDIYVLNIGITTSTTNYVQSDWNQVDDTEVDFIKNKPSIPNAQIQSDWGQTNSSKLDFVKNKPKIPNAQIQSDWGQTNSSKLDFLKNKPSIPDAQIQSDWNQTDTTKLDFIKNKPSTGGTLDIQAGKNITIDKSDPSKPIIASRDFAIVKDGAGYIINNRTDGAFHGTVGTRAFDLSFNTVLKDAVGQYGFSVGYNVNAGTAGIGGGSSVNVGNFGIGGGSGVNVGNYGIGGGSNVTVGVNGIGGGSSVNVGNYGIGGGSDVTVGVNGIGGGSSVNVGNYGIGGGQNVTVGAAGISAGQNVNVGNYGIGGGSNVTVGVNGIGGGSSVNVGNYGIGGGNRVTVGVFGLGSGYRISAPSYGETAHGICNTEYTPQSTSGFNINDRLFSLGNGTDANNRSVAVEVFKDGRTILDKLEVRTLNENTTATKMLVADNTGKVGYQDKVLTKILPTNTSASRTLINSDINNVVVLSNANSKIVVNKDSITRIGDIIHIYYIGTGTCEVVDTGSATLRRNENDSNDLDGQYSRVSVQKITATEYNYFGQLTRA